MTVYRRLRLDAGLFRAAPERPGLRLDLCLFCHFHSQGRFELRKEPVEIGSALERAAICVTNDSGAMHLAVALGTPVVSIFGPTNPVHIGPYGQPQAVVRVDLPCSPCNLRDLSQCPYGHACMQQVSAAMVIERLESALRVTGNG